MARTRPFERPVRRIDQAVLVMIRQYHPHFDDNSRPIPVNRIPLEKRTGVLTIILSQTGLRINGSETGDVYSNGAWLQSGPGCRIYMEVFPRGRSEKEYKLWGRETVLRTVPMPGARTPLVISDQAYVMLNGVSTSVVGGLEHMRLLAPDKLREYLNGVLPLLGVDPADQEKVALYVRRLLLEGQERLKEVAQRVRERRQR
jgi:hypothetical protein